MLDVERFKRIIEEKLSIPAYGKFGRGINDRHLLPWVFGHLDGVFVSLLIALALTLWLKPDLALICINQVLILVWGAIRQLWLDKKLRGKRSDDDSPSKSSD